MVPIHHTYSLGSRGPECLSPASLTASVPTSISQPRWSPPIPQTHQAQICLLAFVPAVPATRNALSPDLHLYAWLLGTQVSAPMAFPDALPPVPS